MPTRARRTAGSSRFPERAETRFGSSDSSNAIGSDSASALPGANETQHGSESKRRSSESYADADTASPAAGTITARRTGSAQSACRPIGLSANRPVGRIVCKPSVFSFNAHHSPQLIIAFLAEMSPGPRRTPLGCARPLLANPTASVSCASSPCPTPPMGIGRYPLREQS
jgi:hypothetical protein